MRSPKKQITSVSHITLSQPHTAEQTLSRTWSNLIKFQMVWHTTAYYFTQAKNKSTYKL